MLVLFALVASMAGFAQVSWNVKGGLNMSTYIGDNSDNSKFKPGGRIGLGMEYAINDMVSLQPSLYFSTKGAKYSGSAKIEGITAKGDVKINQMYLELPIDVQLRFNLVDNTNLIVAAGPYLAYGIGGKTKISASAAGYSDNTKVNTFGNDKKGDLNLKRFDAGINIEAGLEFGSFLAGINTQLGFCKLMEGNSPKNANIGIFVGYKF